MDLADHSPRLLLRHTLATLSYRAAKCLTGAPESFPHFEIAPGARTPIQILAHMGDLFDWALTLVQGNVKWSDATPLPWEGEQERFFASLKRFDDYLASDAPLAWTIERVFQGPVADALTHTGQLAYLRRLAGSPVRPENYAKATIEAGGIAAIYTTRRAEFG